MSGEFLGQSENSVNKMRVIIPAPFKAKFAAASKQTVVCTVGQNKEVLIYPLDNWNTLTTKLKAGTAEEQEDLELMLHFASQEQQLEGPGRIRISDDHLEISGITDSVIIKGEGSYISLWDPKVFNEYRAEKIKELQNGTRKRKYSI